MYVLLMRLMHSAATYLMSDVYEMHWTATVRMLYVHQIHT